MTYCVLLAAPPGPPALPGPAELLEEPAAPDEADEPAAPPDEPEEPAAPEEPPEASPDEASPPGESLVVDAAFAASPSLLRATFFAFFAFFAACLAPVFFGGTLLSASVLSVGATATWFGCPALAAVVLAPFTAAVVELGVALGGWLNDVESVFMAAGAVDDGFAANADALASATIDVMTNIGASLRI